ncbi:uncharacterized protein LOC134775782 [Penaeus indicus]|uniref:uncharacterized protein LOC134775782 n=1 Tax=Penaeus indicus TaxID=29960 RepID=UPI00300CBC8D
MVFIKVLLVAAFCIYQGAANCIEWGLIECQTNNRCVSMRDICDGENDCNDNSDEEHRLCSILDKSGCGSPGSFRCDQKGNVTCKRIKEHCNASNPPCDNRNERLCQMLKDGKLQTNVLSAEISGEEFLEKFNVTIEHPDCPHLYTRVGDHCLSFFFFGLVNWGEARSFCKMNGGDLLTFQDGVGIFYEIVRHLCEHNITSDFWVGGAIRNRTWTWVDGNPIEMGTPYWSLRPNPNCQHRNLTARYNEESCNQFLQRPLTPAVSMCTALTFENYFYMSDEDCLTKKSPLCVAEKEPSLRA